MREPLDEFGQMHGNTLLDVTKTSSQPFKNSASFEKVAILFLTTF